MHYKRIGKEIGDLVALTGGEGDGEEPTVVREGEIRLAEIDYNSNKELCKRLGSSLLLLPATSKAKAPSYVTHGN